MALPNVELKAYDSVLPFKRIEFPTYDGTVLRGNFYHALNTTGPAPIIIFIHGIGLLKEQYLENWFKYCIMEGYHVLTYDHRSFGDSDGMPRHDFSWSGQTEDFIDAVSYARSLPEVMDSRVFAWGVAHAGGIIAMAAAIDKRLAGVILFLPCIDGEWDKSRWAESQIRSSSGTSGSLWDVVQQHRLGPQTAESRAETVGFWPLASDGNVLSGSYVHEWSVVAQRMAEQGGNASFTGGLTLRSFWDDFATVPKAYLAAIAPTPLLWVMASDDVVCGPLSFTQGEYDKLAEPKEICVLEGEHLAQYFGTGFQKSLQVMLSFLRNHTTFAK